MTETGEISPADAAVAIFKARLVAASPLVDEALDLADELVDEVRRLRTELARTEGDLGVAIREAAAAREALKAARGIVYAAARGYSPMTSTTKALALVDAALDQRLAR